MTRANISNVSNQDDFKWKMTSNGRLPSILKVFSQQLPVRSIQNFRLRHLRPEQPFQMLQIKTTSNGRRPKMEDDLKI